jgi:transcriptional regulator
MAEILISAACSSKQMTGAEKKLYCKLITMYDLPYHNAQNEQDIKAFIDQHPFAFLAGSDATHQPIATQLPVFIEEKDGKKILRGHIMKNTDHHKVLLQNHNVLVVFTGPHTYVSGPWYSNPYTPSTRNYMSVPVKGTIRFLEDVFPEQKQTR